jgi:hypothetical protein
MTAGMTAQVPAAQTPEVPWLVMPEGAQTVATVSVAAVAVVVLAVVTVHSLRHRTPLYLLVLLGGAIASLNEPMVDLLGGCLHPQAGGWTVFSTFDRPIPVWVVIAYGLFFGAVPLAVRALMASGSPRTRLLQGVAVIFAANLLIELPILAGGVYVYYGPQPFLAFGLFPLHWLFINASAVAGIAVVLYRWPAAMHGRRALAVVAVPPALQLAGVAAAIPAFSLYNSGAGPLPTALGSLATMAIGAASIWVTSRLLPVRRTPAVAPAVPVPASTG